ncbi:MAG: hypothetical protein H0T05_01310 [Acidobacteria bacterium]|nr:hypothetical protein [Acidobacteriota bacterium]MBA3884124.1 hypothetical protein [Acidobacteriota bacterium]
MRACLAAALALLTLPAGAQQTPFTSAASAVPVFVTVTDRDRRLVPGLDRDDFELYDNGQRQEITV